MGGIQESQSVELNLENEGKMQDKEIEKNGLTYRWFLIDATMPIVFMSEIVKTLNLTVEYVFQLEAYI